MQLVLIRRLNQGRAAIGLDYCRLDANGAVARDFSFRVDTDPRFQSLIKARTVGGVIESTERADLKMRDVETAGFFPPQLQLLHAKLRITPTQDGKMNALVGGYRPIDDYWSGWAGAGVIHESTTHINLPGYWYALHRNADYGPDASGKNTAISTAYQMYLTPAFVIFYEGVAGHGWPQPSVLAGVALTVLALLVLAAVRDQPPSAQTAP